MPSVEACYLRTTLFVTWEGPLHVDSLNEYMDVDTLGIAFTPTLWSLSFQGWIPTCIGILETDICFLSPLASCKIPCFLYVLWLGFVHDVH